MTPQAPRKERAILDKGVRAELTYELARRCVMGVENVGDVAIDLGISRTFAHALLQAARAKNEIKTVISVERPRGDELREAVTRRLAEFGVKTVRIVAAPADDRQLNTPSFRATLSRSLGVSIAELVEERIDEIEEDRGAIAAYNRPAITIGLGDGQAIRSFAEEVSLSTASPLVFRPQVAGKCGPNIWSDANATLQLLAWRVAHSPIDSRPVHVLTAECPAGLVPEINRLIQSGVPSLPPSGTSSAGHHQRPSSQYGELLTLFGPDVHPPDITVSCVEPCRLSLVPKAPDAYSDYVRMMAATMLSRSDSVQPGVEDHRSLSPDYYEELSRQLDQMGIVGSVVRQGIDVRGKERPGLVDDFTVHVRLEHLRAWRTERSVRNILVGSGSLCLYAMLGALRSRCFDSVVIDTALAVQLVPPGTRPAAYQIIPVLRSRRDDPSPDPYRHPSTYNFELAFGEARDPKD